MKHDTKGTRWLMAVVAVLVLAVAAIYPQVSEAADAEPATIEFSGWIGSVTGNDELLAEALDITVEELEAARQEAADAAIDQALEEGLITETQAELLRARGTGLLRGRIHWLPGFDQSNINHKALLAGALGISVEELETAMAEASAAALDRAVETGRITREQADMLLARQALQEYLAERMQAAYAEAVQAALDDGAITQEQADQLLEEQGPGLFFRQGSLRKPGGHRGLLGGFSSGFHDEFRGGFHRGGPDRSPGMSLPDGDAQGSSWLTPPVTF